MSFSAEEGMRLRIAAVDNIIDYITYNPDDPWVGPQEAFILSFDEIMRDLLLRTEDESLSPQQVASVVEIMTAGTYEGKRVDMPYLHHRSGGWNHNWPESAHYLEDARRSYTHRMTLAELAIRDYAAFVTLLKDNIIGFHGTRGLQLPQILEREALLSHSEQRLRGYRVGSGELDHLQPRTFVSFCDTSDLGVIAIKKYADEDPRSSKRMKYLWRLVNNERESAGYHQRWQELKDYNTWLQREKRGSEYLRYANKNRFGVVFGLADAAVNDVQDLSTIGKRVSVQADVPEIAFMEQVGLPYLPVLAVDNRHKEAVQALLLKSGIEMPHIISLTSLRSALAASAKKRNAALAAWRTSRSQFGAKVASR